MMLTAQDENETFEIEITRDRQCMWVAYIDDCRTSSVHWFRIDLMIEMAVFYWGVPLSLICPARKA